jgi:hypothetical protein
MREAQFAAPLIADYLAGANRDQPNPFAAHQLFCEQGADILEDTLDCFWEQPLAFALSVHQRYTEYMTDMFAGRIYGHERQPSPALLAFRKLLKRQQERQRSYQSADRYSIPIGSRYHPERAAIWEINSPIASTETWMGLR